MVGEGVESELLERFQVEDFFEIGLVRALA